MMERGAKLFVPGPAAIRSATSFWIRNAALEKKRRSSQRRARNGPEIEYGRFPIILTGGLGHPGDQILERNVQGVTLDHGDVGRFVGGQAFRQNTVDFDGHDFSDQGRQRPRQGSLARADFDHDVVRTGIDRAGDFVEEAWVIEKMLAERLSPGLHRAAFTVSRV
jgi:hypothetical protein